MKTPYLRASCLAYFLRLRAPFFCQPLSGAPVRDEGADLAQAARSILRSPFDRSYRRRSGSILTQRLFSTRPNARRVDQEREAAKDKRRNEVREFGVNGVRAQ